MTHTVQLEVGMTAMRHDGERGLVGINGAGRMTYSYVFESRSYKPDGSAWGGYVYDIIAAGYPWAELGAQVGDTVRLVWNGYSKKPSGETFKIHFGSSFFKDSLLVIVKTAAKPAIRPRASHKLDLRDGDVVELVGWKDDDNFRVGDCFEYRAGYLETFDYGEFESEFEGKFLTNYDKGHRPLFRVISRAADAKPVVWTELVIGENLTQPVMRMPADATPDDVIVRYAGEGKTSAWYFVKYGDCTHRLTITFPHGSDTGTVVREKL